MKILSFLALSLFLVGCDSVGYKHEEGVLKSGTLIEFRITVPNIGHQAVGVINGKKMAVTSWKISYIDSNGKYGSCHYYAPRGAQLKINTHITCDDQILEFN